MRAEVRSWCKYCLAGKAVSRQHEKGNQDEEPLRVMLCEEDCFWTPEECEKEMDAILAGYVSDLFRSLDQDGECERSNAGRRDGWRRP